MDANRTHTYFTRPLKARFTVIDEEVSYFNRFVHAQSYPVMLRLIKFIAKMIAEQQGLTRYKALRGCIHKFLRRYVCNCALSCTKRRTCVT